MVINVGLLFTHLLLILFTLKFNLELKVMGAFSNKNKGVQGVREHVFQVTARDIKRFAQAIGDTNPLYVDEVFAKKSSFGAIIAPPLFCQVMAFEDVPVEELPADLSPIELAVDLPVNRTVGGSSKYEFYQYVSPGDMITVTSSVVSVEQKQGRNGMLFLVSVETRYKNQFGERVAKEVATYVKK